ncbi:unnamed protein product [Heligmosomoides polygyrus]|uniref:Reverse transcriptase domain-containing protein n=1 Tax=Heligmosomoides polygyrus TaxID=6339 RepID=A0A183GET3_HELPZ|nr:unnamed protein product [Heligmosomoides polygyrus]
MKLGKASGPDGVPVEAWKVLRDLGINWLTQFLNRITKEGEMPEEWRSSTIVLLKQKGDASECSNYRGIKLISYTAKIYERLVDSRLREIVPISQVQFHAREVHHRRHLHRSSGDGEISGETKTLLPGISGPKEGLRQATPGPTLECPSKEVCRNV